MDSTGSRFSPIFQIRSEKYVARSAPISGDDGPCPAKNALTPKYCWHYNYLFRYRRVQQVYSRGVWSMIFFHSYSTTVFQKLIPDPDVIPDYTKFINYCCCLTTYVACEYTGTGGGCSNCWESGGGAPRTSQFKKKKLALGLLWSKFLLEYLLLKTAVTVLHVGKPFKPACYNYHNHLAFYLTCPFPHWKVKSKYVFK